MSDPTILDAPDLAYPAARDEPLRREQRAFLALLPSLLATHRDRYVAVHGGQVIGSGPTLVEVAMDAYRRVGYVPVYVDLVTDRPQEPVHVPSIRNVEDGRLSRK